MPILTNSIGSHTDSLHQGSAKRNGASGVKGVDAAGALDPKLVIADIDAAILNAANGLPKLDASALVPLAQLPAPVVSLSTGKLIDTEYQNGARPRLVIITVAMDTSVNNTTSPKVVLGTKSTVGVAATDNPSTQYFSVQDVNANTKYLTANIVKVIPANYYYKLITVTAILTVSQWDEIQL